MRKILLTISVFAVVAAVVLFYVLGFPGNPDQPIVKSERTRNKFVHTFDDPEEAERELEKAWKRFQAADGGSLRTDGKPHGFSDHQIDELEREMRQRLPADLKTFLKTYKSHGDWFNGLEWLDPDHICELWRERSSMGISMVTGNMVRLDEPSDGPPLFCEPYVLIIAREHLDEFGYDLRNGKVIEVMDCDAGWMADSLAVMLDEMSRHIENGKRVSTYIWEIEDLDDADRYRSKFLDSVMWHIYELPLELEETQ